LNFTLALLAGLVLLMPGLAALASWNVLGASEEAKRPELQLTSVLALFMALGTAIVMHVLGYGITSLIWASAVEIGERLPAAWSSPLLPNPYEMAISVAVGTAKPTAAGIEGFLLTVLAECLLVFRLATSRGLDIEIEGADLRSLGWVFQHVVRPARNGYTPIAVILTTPAQGDYGLGYEGVVGDVRQGDNGELKSISLAAPQRFQYRLVPDDGVLRAKMTLVTGPREWIGGVVALEAAVVRSIVVHNVDLASIDPESAPPAAGPEVAPVP
jgi:hypothetical protein